MSTPHCVGPRLGSVAGVAQALVAGPLFLRRDVVTDRPGDYTERMRFVDQLRHDLDARQREWEQAHQAVAGFKAELRSMFGGAPPLTYDQFEHYTHRLVNFLTGGILDAPYPMLSPGVQQFLGDGPSEMGEGDGVAAGPSSDPAGGQDGPLPTGGDTASAFIAPGADIAAADAPAPPLTAGELRASLAAQPAGLGASDQELTGLAQSVAQTEAPPTPTPEAFIAAEGIDPALDPGTPHVENAVVQPGDHTSFDVPTTEAEHTEVLPQPEHDPAAQS